jgi:hypothetical protein
MSQTVYASQPDKGVSGTLVTEANAVKRTYVAASALTPGRYAGIDSAGKAAHLTAAPTAATRGGLVIRNMYKDNDGVIAAGEPCELLEAGNMWVTVESTCAQNGAVFIRHTAGAGGSGIGAARLDADTATAAAIAGLYFREALAATGVANVDINQSAA